MIGGLVDLDVDLADGPAVVTVRILSLPTRQTMTDPADPGEWELRAVWTDCRYCQGRKAVSGIACSWCGATGVEPKGVTSNDLVRIDRAVAEWLADKVRP